MKVAVAVFIACLISIVYAQPGSGRGRGRPGGRGPGGPRPFGRGRLPDGVDLSVWNRTLDGQDVRETGFANAEDNVVVVSSRDRVLRNLTRVGASTLYDFNGTSLIVAAKLGPVCVVFPSDFQSTLTFEAAAADVNNRNETTIGAPANQLLLNLTDAQPLDSVSESVSRFCRRRRVVQAVEADAATFPQAGAEVEGARVARFTTLDTDVQALIPNRGRGRPGGRPGFPGGRPRGPGGRQGGRGRGRGRGGSQG